VTLTELMVTVAVAILLLAAAAPSFIEQIERQRLIAVKDELVAALQLTRMETLSRDERGFIKPGASATLTCYVFAINGLTTNTPPETCDCTKTGSNPVCPDANAKLLGVVQVPKSTGVTISTHASDAPAFVYFNRATGGLEVLTDDVGGSRPVEYGFRIRGERAGEILLMVSVGGRPSACQVGGTSLGLTECPSSSP
jgi:type II secretory pathway pseudopilin PulG